MIRVRSTHETGVPGPERFYVHRDDAEEGPGVFLGVFMERLRCCYLQGDGKWLPESWYWSTREAAQQACDKARKAAS
jgi:hypothetical protein